MICNEPGGWTLAKSGIALQSRSVHIIPKEVGKQGRGRELIWWWVLSGIYKRDSGCGQHSGMNYYGVLDHLCIVWCFCFSHWLLLLNVSGLFQCG